MGREVSGDGGLVGGAAQREQRLRVAEQRALHIERQRLVGIHRQLLLHAHGFRRQVTPKLPRPDAVRARVRVVVRGCRAAAAEVGEAHAKIIVRAVFQHRTRIDDGRHGRGGRGFAAQDLVRDVVACDERAATPVRKIQWQPTVSGSRRVGSRRDGFNREFLRRRAETEGKRALRRRER